MKTRGLKKYWDKETYIIELCKNNKEIFKEILKTNIQDIYVEVRFNKNKVRVDLLGEGKNGSLVFTEVSLRYNCVNDFVTHRNEIINILGIIGKYKFAQIVLMSPDFLNEDIKTIEKLIASYNVKVYFVYIPMELLFNLQNNIYCGFNEKNFIYNGPIIGKSINVTSRIVNIRNLFLLTLNNEKCGNYIAQAILSGLREALFCHFAVHTFKDLSKNIIKIGTSTSDIMLNIYCGMNDKIKIELDFAQRVDVFIIFKDYMADMCDEIGNSIDIAPKSPKIFTKIPILENKQTTINTTIVTAKKYIEYAKKMYRKIQL